MPLFHTRTLPVCLVVIATTLTISGATLAGSPSAQEPPAPAHSSSAITLRDAIRATLEKNPDLKAFSYSLLAQDARIEHAAQRPALELQVDLENVGGTGDARGLNDAEATLALSRVIEFGDKRGRRVEVASLARGGIRIEQQAAQLDRLAEVSRRFIHVAADQKQLDLTVEAVRLANSTVIAVKRRVDAAKSPEVELHRANVELMLAELELEHAQHELLSSRVKLAAMWGERRPDFVSVSADLYALPTLGSFEKFVVQLERNPDFTRFTTAARLQDAELRLAQAQRRPDFTVSAGIRRLEASDDQAFVLGFSVPLGARSRAQPAIAESSALAAQVEVRKASAIVDVHAQLFEIFQELHHSISEAQTLRDRVLPQMQEALSETEYAYERGRYSYLELVDAQRAYLNVQRALIVAAADSHTLQAELERLTAQPLAASGEMP